MVYFDRILEGFIHAKDPKHNRLPQKFRCRTPIDDALVIYFQNRNTKRYHKIQCADRSMPSMTRHELKQISKHLKKKGMCQIDMEAIKKARKELKAMEDEIIANSPKSSEARSVRRKRAVTESLNENGSPLPHKVKAKPPTPPTPPQDFDLADIPIFKVDNE